MSEKKNEYSSSFSSLGLNILHSQLHLTFLDGRKSLEVIKEEKALNIKD
jgi:hypothetical protein